LLPEQDETAQKHEKKQKGQKVPKMRISRNLVVVSLLFVCFRRREILPLILCSRRKKKKIKEKKVPGGGRMGWTPYQRSGVARS